MGENFTMHAVAFCTNILVSMYIYYNNNNITGNVSSPLSCPKGQFPTGSVRTNLAASRSRGKVLSWRHHVNPTRVTIFLVSVRKCLHRPVTSSELWLEQEKRLGRISMAQTSVILTQTLMADRPTTGCWWQQQERQLSPTYSGFPGAPHKMSCHHPSSNPGLRVSHSFLFLQSFKFLPLLPHFSHM